MLHGVSYSFHLIGLRDADYRLVIILLRDNAASSSQTAEALFLVFSIASSAVSYTHLTLPTNVVGCRSRWSPYH